jgi:hypothetical protein
LALNGNRILRVTVCWQHLTFGLLVIPLMPYFKR